jgi:hypothetical protein
VLAWATAQVTMLFAVRRGGLLVKVNAGVFDARSASLLILCKLNPQLPKIRGEKPSQESVCPTAGRSWKVSDRVGNTSPSPVSNARPGRCLSCPAGSK